MTIRSGVSDSKTNRSEPPMASFAPLRRAPGLRGCIELGAEGSKSPPGRAEMSGAASAFSLPCLCDLHSRRLFANSLGAWAVLDALLAKLALLLLVEDLPMANTFLWIAPRVAARPPRVDDIPLIEATLPCCAEVIEGASPPTLGLGRLDVTSPIGLGFERLWIRGSSSDEDCARFFCTNLLLSLA